MNELQVLDIIRQGFGVRELPVPEGMQRHVALSHWRDIARRIVDECNHAGACGHDQRGK